MHEFHMPHPPQEPEWKQLELAPGMQHFFWILDFRFWIIFYFFIYFCSLSLLLACRLEMEVGTVH